MLFLRRQRQLILGFILLLLATVAGAGWWFCRHDDSIAFLPEMAGAKWIIDSAPPEGNTHWAAPVKNTFSHTFVVPTPPTEAVLAVCAFNEAAVFVNGQEIAELKCVGKNWKQPLLAPVAGQLHAGTNTITVWATNRLGPPALWIHLQAGDLSIGSDASWKVSCAGTYWHEAHLADEPVAIPRWSPLHDGISTFDALKKIWLELVVFFAVSLGAVFVIRRRTAERKHAGLIYILFAVIVVIRTALFWHDTTRLPDWAGFDEPAHREYIEFILKNGTLPVPNQGWESHQPPLYYLLGSAVLKGVGFCVAKPDVLMVLRSVNWLVGIAQCWVALLCLRRLFPGQLQAQAVGLLVAAFIPAGLYLSMYVANDLLAGLLVTTAFFFVLKAFQSEPETMLPYAGAGLAMGLAMLTKLTALPAVLVLLCAIGLRLLLIKSSATHWLRSLGIVIGICVLTCGWHYQNYWMQTGAIPIPHHEGSAWWQNPGFRTANYYIQFGTALANPLFSGWNSFADGIYSTWWGDGLISGGTEMIFRPPWNYDLMKAGYLFSLGPTILLLVGVGLFIRRFTRDLNAQSFMVLTIPLAYLTAILCLTLLGPWLSQVKAFYAIPALLPLSAIIAAGWNWLAQRNPAWRMFLWVAISVWSLTTCATYWIQDAAPETLRCRAMMELKKQNFEAAGKFAIQAVQLDPNNFENRCTLADILIYQGKSAEAIQQYSAALEINPDSPDILNLIGQALSRGRPDNAEQAIKYIDHACELTGYRRDDLISSLAQAYLKAGLTEKATNAAQAAIELASQKNHPDLVKQNQQILENARLGNR